LPVGPGSKGARGGFPDDRANTWPENASTSETCIVDCLKKLIACERTRKPTAAWRAKTRETSVKLDPKYFHI